LGVGLGLKDHAGCLGNQRGCILTLFFVEQQKKHKKEKQTSIFNQHFK